MKKAVTSRIRKTKNGKLIRRHMGLGHFRAKKSSKQKQRINGQPHVDSSDVRMFRKYLGS